nr:class A beta-lactamase [Rhodovastum atsumiense]
MAVGGTWLLAGAGLPACGTARAQAAAPEARLAALEREHGGRLGVAVLDVATGHRIAYRAEERFPLCSTFKVLAAALVLARVDRGKERLDRRVVFSREDIRPWSPVTEKHPGAPGMTLAELCEAAVTLSDNTAGNLLLGSFGGPAGLTGFARALGDDVTRLDRFETALNEGTPGDPRDTTTPAAMLGNMRRIMVGDALSESSRTQLAGWLLGSRTGGRRLRAGFPPDWRVGDKTGGNGTGVANDIAIAWPPGGGALLVAAYYAESPGPEERRNAVLAEVGRIAVPQGRP